MSIYLDYAAATPVDDRVLAVMQPYFTDKFYNPSALYLQATAVSKDLAAARAVVAECMGARPVEITFTAGATEANNLAIQGVMRAYPGTKVLVSAIEHDSILAPARLFEHAEVPVRENGVMDTNQLAALIDDQTSLISIMLANNEIGTVQPIRQIAEVVAEVRKSRRSRGIKLPLYLHTDAAQAANYLDIHVARLGVDMMSLNGGKIYGPKQSGVLYVRSGTVLQPLIYGGGQERGLRSGTENVAGAIGFAKALQLTVAMQNEEVGRMQSLQRHFMQQVERSLPSAVINGSIKRRLPNNVHITLPGTDNERLLFALDARGIMAAVGSACSASSEEASHVLHALGLDDDAARASLRFTMGRHTTESDVDTAVQALAELLAN